MSSHPLGHNIKQVPPSPPHHFLKGEWDGLHIIDKDDLEEDEVIDIL